MTTALERIRNGAAARALARYGEAATRIHPTVTTVHGQAVTTYTDAHPVKAVITARSGDVKEQGWGQTAVGQHSAVIDMADGWVPGDLLDADEGVWAGKRFRATFVDAQSSQIALDLVHAGNA